MTGSARCLMMISVVVGAIAVATLALSVATDAWLYTSELKEKNSTFKEHTLANLGLWKVCTNADISDPPSSRHDGTMKCITYHALSSDDVQETSFAIMRATRVAALFPVASLVLITVAVILGILGNIRKDIKTLIAAVIAILAEEAPFFWTDLPFSSTFLSISDKSTHVQTLVNIKYTMTPVNGLTLVVGIIFYISAINDEVGHRTKGKEGKQFEYRYGWSFFFAGIAFVVAEGTAVVLVTQFMQRNSSKDDMARIIPGLEDKFDGIGKRDNNENGHTNPTIVL